MSTVFFGYPSTPASMGETMRHVARELGNQLPGTRGITWEELQPAGRVVIRKILDAIDSSDMCVFDITDPNPNVLFEVGYAIGRAKPLWLLRDGTVESADDMWRKLAILRPIGYQSYQNSGDLLAKFVSEDPLSNLTPVYDDLIDPALPEEPQPRRSLLYCPTFAQYEASNRLSNLMADRRKSGVTVLASDPQESSLESLVWYAPKIVEAAGVLVHYAGPSRTRATTFNLRHAVVAGLSVGLDTPVLMLAEHDYRVPFDYEELLRKYELAGKCVHIAREWLNNLTYEGHDWSAPRKTLKSGLQGLRFGEHVAENELDSLPEYFVETAAYADVVAARDAIFVGHRGTGKTANATQAYEEIARNKTNMAVLIKPPGFEFPALMDVVARIPSSQHDYFFDALWRFVIQSEIGAVALAFIDAKPTSVPRSSEELGFLKFVEGSSFNLRKDLSVRLEQALSSLTATVQEPGANAFNRDFINEAFHAEALATLRHELGPVLKGRHRVAVFVDNLDKGWERGADFPLMARFILGLLTARGSVAKDFARSDFWRDRIKLTLSVFLRSDIYNYLRDEAREPDKLPLSTIAWRDPETLLSVVESRFSVTPFAGGLPDALWSKYFCGEIDERPVRDYLTSVVLPRPRDIVYFCNSAVGFAIDRRHLIVEPIDLKSAEAVYSQYAYEALLVENGVTIPEMEEALLALLGANEILTEKEILDCFGQAGMGSDRAVAVLDKLVSSYFFGMEIRLDTYHYPEVGSDMKRSKALAALTHTGSGNQRYRIHKAFHGFLLVERSAASHS